MHPHRHDEDDCDRGRAAGLEVVPHSGKQPRSPRTSESPTGQPAPAPPREMRCSPSPGSQSPS